MSPPVLVKLTESTQEPEAAHELTYLVTPADEGDLETGVLLLDGQPIGRLSRRPRRPAAYPHRPAEPLPEPSLADSVWHAEAVGWLPHDGRPWDSRITSTAPTRRRAAEDLLRAYRNHR
ncbi:MAG TPA: hypothetical protein VGQ47_00065 [Candidatus Limnocylindrales bacterium]|nr:hypothetical protein [Candidatus Limnocylindrales bacterium]